MYCMQCFLKNKYIKVELSMIKIGELLRKLWSLRSCFLILPPVALAPQGIKCAVKRDVSKHWCTLQWCASRGWVIAHENWTSCIRSIQLEIRLTEKIYLKVICTLDWLIFMGLVMVYLLKACPNSEVATHNSIWDWWVVCHYCQPERPVRVLLYMSPFL